MDSRCLQTYSFDAKNAGSCTDSCTEGTRVKMTLPVMECVLGETVKSGFGRTELSQGVHSIRKNSS